MKSKRNLESFRGRSLLVRIWFNAGIALITDVSFHSYKKRVETANPSFTITQTQLSAEFNKNQTNENKIQKKNLENVKWEQKIAVRLGFWVVLLSTAWKMTISEGGNFTVGEVLCVWQKYPYYSENPLEIFCLVIIQYKMCLVNAG